MKAWFPLQRVQMDPEHFVLALDQRYYVSKPNDSVLKAERRLVMMSVCELAQFPFPHYENNLNESSNTPLPLHPHLLN